MGKIKSLLFVIFFLILTVLFTSQSDWFFSWPIASAEAESESNNEFFHITIDQPTIAKGYTVGAFDDAIKLSLTPGILSEATPVDVILLRETMRMPWLLDRASEIYQFEFGNKDAYDDHIPYYIQIAYNEFSDTLKQVFFFDNNFGTWRPLPTRDFPEEKFVRSLIHLPFARIAVFSYPNTMSSGRASWYSYKPGNFVASPDFPKGSRLRVYNNENGNFVDVEINDYGPDRKIFPDRAIDLSKEAFARIAPLSQGVADITIEPLYIANDSTGRIMGISGFGMNDKPEITAKAALLIDEASGAIYFGKNATSVLPLASLTKMVAVKVFLDTKPTLTRVVSYSRADEEYNYEHVNYWESAELNIEDGERISIEDLVYASLVGSTNNTIESLVRVSGLKRAEFIDIMNATVRQWGASSTSFIEPSGLAPENVSSAFDYAIITKEVLKNPIIEKASKMLEYKLAIYSENGLKSKRIKNTNHIIRTNKFHITGSKTGYLDEAGYCLMVRAKGSNGNNIIVIIFGATERGTSFNEAERLLLYGFKISQDK